MSLESFLGKKYKLDSSENFDEYMKALGVNVMIRKVASSISPVIELKKTADGWSIISASSFKTSEFSFKEGAELEHDTPDGRKVKSVFKINGTTIHETEVDCSNGKQATIERSFSDTEVKMILKIDNIVCTRIYKAQ